MLVATPKKCLLHLHLKKLKIKHENDFINLSLVKNQLRKNLTRVYTKAISTSEA